MFEEGVTYKKGPHIRLDCPECAAFIQFLPQNNIPKNLKDFIIPFKKHKGKTLKEISLIDKEYLVWISENNKEKIGLIVKEYLKGE